MNKIAVAVGYSFGVVSKEDVKHINLSPIGKFVEVKDEIYELYTGNTFEDSGKIDSLLDGIEEYSINKYSVDDLIDYIDGNSLAINRMAKDKDFKTKVSIRLEKEFMSVENEEISGDLILK